MSCEIYINMLVCCISTWWMNDLCNILKIWAILCDATVNTVTQTPKKMPKFPLEFHHYKNKRSYILFNDLLKLSLVKAPHFVKGLFSDRSLNQKADTKQRRLKYYIHGISPFQRSIKRPEFINLYFGSFQLICVIIWSELVS